MAKIANILEIAFAFDDNYLVPFYVLLTSIFENNRRSVIRVHAVATGIDELQKGQIKNYVQEKGSQIIFYNIDEEFIKEFAISNEPRYTIAVYYRLFIPYLISLSINKVLYLDIDTIVLADLSELYNLDFGLYPIAVASDANFTRPDLGITETGKYFNSGVMLINLRRWRELDLTQRSIEFLTQYPEKAQYHDQDALNVILKENWFRIESKYNLTFQVLPPDWWIKDDYFYILTSKDRSLSVKAEFEIFLKDKTIIHYNHTIKPWLFGSYHPLRYLFNDYFIKFSELATGELVITKIFKFSFIYLMIKAFENNSTQLETRMLFAFFLHINWIKLVMESDHDNTSFDNFNQYYRFNQLNDQESISIDFKTEFENNRGLLGEIFKEIMEDETVIKTNGFEWIEKWKEICRNEVLRLNEINEKDNSTIISELINLQLAIDDEARSLLLYFITKITKEFHFDKFSDKT